MNKEKPTCNWTGETHCHSNVFNTWQAEFSGGFEAEVRVLMDSVSREKQGKDMKRMNGVWKKKKA